MRTTWTRAALAAALTVLVLVGLNAGPAAFAGQATRGQTSPSTSTPPGGSAGTPTTTDDLLNGPPTTATTTTTPKVTKAPSRRVADDNRRVWLVVAALVAVAVLLALLTVWYWVRTRPSRVVAAIGPPSPEEDRGTGLAPDGGTNATNATNAATGARRGSTDVLDEVRSNGDQSADAARHPERVERSSARRPVRPQRAQREAALRRARGLSR